MMEQYSDVYIIVICTISSRAINRTHRQEETSVFVIYFYLSFVFCFLQNSAVSKINVYKLRERGLVLINNVHIHQSFIREIECMNHSINQPAID